MAFKETLFGFTVASVAPQLFQKVDRLFIPGNGLCPLLLCGIDVTYIFEDRLLSGLIAIARLMASAS